MPRMHFMVKDERGRWQPVSADYETRLRAAEDDEDVVRLSDDSQQFVIFALKMLQDRTTETEWRIRWREYSASCSAGLWSGECYAESLIWANGSIIQNLEKKHGCRIFVQTAVLEKDDEERACHRVDVKNCKSRETLQAAVDEILTSAHSNGPAPDSAPPDMPERTPSAIAADEQALRDELVRSLLVMFPHLSAEAVRDELEPLGWKIEEFVNKHEKDTPVKTTTHHRFQGTVVESAGRSDGQFHIKPGAEFGKQPSNIIASRDCVENGVPVIGDLVEFEVDETDAGRAVAVSLFPSRSLNPDAKNKTEVAMRLITTEFDRSFQRFLDEKCYLFRTFERGAKVKECTFDMDKVHKEYVKMYERFMEDRLKDIGVDHENFTKELSDLLETPESPLHSEPFVLQFWTNYGLATDLNDFGTFMREHFDSKKISLKVFLFWDMDNISVPRHGMLDGVMRRLESKIKELPGVPGVETAVITKDGIYNCDTRARINKEQMLSLAHHHGVRMQEQPAKKEAVDRAIEQQALERAAEYKPNALIGFISNDMDFLRASDSIRRMGCKTILFAQFRENKRLAELKDRFDFHIDWADVLSEAPLPANMETSAAASLDPQLSDPSVFKVGEEVEAKYQTHSRNFKPAKVVEVRPGELLLQFDGHEDKVLVPDQPSRVRCRGSLVARPDPPSSELPEGTYLGEWTEFSGGHGKISVTACLKSAIRQPDLKGKGIVVSFVQSELHLSLKKNKGKKPAFPRPKDKQGRSRWVKFDWTKTKSKAMMARKVRDKDVDLE